MRPFLIAVALVAAAACGGGVRTPTSPSNSTPPVPQQAALAVSCPSNVAASTTSADGMTVSYAAAAASGGTAPVDVSCTPPSNSRFPIGQSTVTCTATDAARGTASCSFVVNVTRIPTISRTRFLAFGDSVTAGEVTVPASGASWDGATVNTRQVVLPLASYPERLRQLLVGRYTAQIPNIQMTNAGRSGEQAVDAVSRLPGVLSAARPDVVILLHGYNDLNALGTRGVTPAIAAMDAMAKEARLRGARVFLLSLTPPRLGGVNAPNASVVVTYNSRLQDIARGEGARFVDVYGPLRFDINRFIGPDGLHPTEAGYREIANLLFDAVRQELENR